MKKEKEIEELNEFRRIVKSNSIGNSNRIGNSDSIGKTDSIGNSNRIGNSDSIGKSNRIGNSDSIGKTDSIGKSNRIGKTDSIGNLDLSFKKVRGRREFFDLVGDFIKKTGLVSEIKLKGILQYTTGASETSINQALAVLESIDLIECIEEEKPPFERSYKIKKLKEKEEDLK